MLKDPLILSKQLSYLDVLLATREEVEIENQLSATIG